MFNDQLDSTIEFVRDMKKKIDDSSISDAEFRALVRKGLENTPSWLF